MRKVLAVPILSLFAAAILLVPATSPAQSMQLVPIFSITGADMDQHLSQPSDVFVDEKHGEIYVVDSGNRRVVVFDMDGFYRYQFVVSGGSGSPNSLVVNDRDEILVTIDGKVAVCDFRGSLLEYADLDGFPDAENVHATRLRIDQEGSCYLLDAVGRRVLVFGGEWDFRFAIDQSALPEDTKTSLSIADIWVDDVGMIYLVDGMASHVYAFTHEGRYIRSIGEPGATFSTLSLPNGVAVDPQGRVLVVDTTGHGLLGYTKRGRLLFALGGLGRSEGRFYFPKYISTDKNGKIYVVEPMIGRIQVLSVQTSS